MSKPAKPAVALDSEGLEPQLPVFRFGLRQLFWLLTLSGLVLAGVLAAPVPGMAPAAVLLGVLVVVFHVAGTALGSRLQDHADQRIAWEKSDRKAIDRSAEVQALASAPRSSWHERGRPVRWRWWLVSAGATLGGMMGAAIFFFTAARFSPAAIACGAFSMAVLGGWFAFLASHFWTIFRRGWREAVTSEPSNGKRPVS